MDLLSFMFEICLFVSSARFFSKIFFFLSVVLAMCIWGIDLLPDIWLSNALSESTVAFSACGCLLSGAEASCTDAHFTCYC